MIGWIVCGFLGAGSALLAGGCAAGSSPTTMSAQTPGEPGPGQLMLDSDDALASALVAAAKAQDHEQVHRLLGPAWKELVSGDKVEDANAFKEFAARAEEGTRLEKVNDSMSILHVGKDDWSFPIPIVRQPDGKWFLDTESGKAEILARRIGKDELEAIQICRIYVDAQREYESKDRDCSGVIKYAQKILSSPGKTDGLYWTTSAGREPSPLAHLIAQAKLEGYQPTPGHPQPYRGYRFRVLKRQGPSAPGGQYDYVINGNMVAGFALVAYPAEYGASGIMTLLVNQNGTVYQKDLGADTNQIARQITAYNPDSSWTPVEE
jgi:hypothetical protein